MLKLAAPTLGRHGRPNTRGILIVLPIMRQTRCRRVTTAFVARMASRLRREETTTLTSDFHGRLLSDRVGFALASGLMEITYDTGTRVILQGPVTYEVESKNGGFLPIGRLTGKVEAETAKGFYVRTPTATVTDLGTEFGIEVDQEQHFRTEVFRGQVKLTWLASHGTYLQEQTLEAGQSGQYDGKTITIKTAKSTSVSQFVRQLANNNEPVMPPRAELIVNGGGENVQGDKPIGWKLDSRSGFASGRFSSFADSPHNGSRRLTIWNNAACIISAMYQEHTYTNGFSNDVTKLEFHGWFRPEHFPSVARIEVIIGNNTNGNIIVHDRLAFDTADITKWTEVHGTLSVHHGTGNEFSNYVKIRLVADFNDGVGSRKAAQFDDLSLFTVSGAR